MQSKISILIYLIRKELAKKQTKNKSVEEMISFDLEQLSKLKSDLSLVTIINELITAYLWYASDNSNCEIHSCRLRGSSIYKDKTLAVL